MRSSPVADAFEESEAEYEALEEASVKAESEESFEEDGLEEEEEVEGARSPGVAKSPVMEEVGEFLNLVWPVALTSVIEFVPSLVSIGVVGHYCDRNALDGAALGNMYFNVAALSIGFGLTTALDTLAPQAVGAGKPKLLGVYVQRGGLVLAVVLVPLSIAAFFAGPILEGLGQPAAVARRAGQYVLWMLPSLPCYWAFELVRKAYHSFSAVRPLVAIGALSTLVHCVLALLFVATDLVYPFGFVGAALARSVSMLVALASLCLHSHLSGLSARWWDGLAPWSLLTRDIRLFLHLGGAGCAAICLEWWAFEFLALLAGLLPRRPDVYIGAHAVLFNLAALFYMGLSGASSAASVRTGLALGRGDPRRAALAVAVALSFACALGAANALVLYLCRDPLPALFANDRAIRTAAAAAMPALACYQVFDAWNAVTGGVMRGAGKQEQPALIMLAAYYVFGIPAAVLCAFVFRLRLVGLWSGLTFGLVVASALLAISLSRFDWRHLAEQAVERANAARSNSFSQVPADDRDSIQTTSSAGLSLARHPAHLGENDDADDLAAC